MRLSHNIASLNIYNSYTKVLQRQSLSIERISSGQKIQSAKDDPSIIAQSEKIKVQIRGLQMAGKNAQDGVGMLQTAEGGLQEISSMLQRVRELTVQAGNGTNSVSDRQQIQLEIDQMIGGVNDTANNTEFNGVKLLSGGKSPASSEVYQLEMAVGANPGENIKIPIYSLVSKDLPTNSTAGGEKNLDDLQTGGSLSITDKDNIDEALNLIDKAIEAVTSTRSKYGAIENRFDATAANTNELADRMQAADSEKTDTDIASEMMEFAKDNVLSDAGNAMMAQTNKMPQDILRILDNVRSI